MKHLRSRPVYRNAWLSLQEDDVELESGATGVYGVVTKPDFAVTVPATASGFWLVEQYRYPVRRRAWEFPQGSWPTGSSGTPLELARSELREECGLLAGRLEHVGFAYEAYGFATHGFDVFLATDLTACEPDPEETEGTLVQRHVTRAEFGRLVRTGEVVDGATLAAYALLLCAEASADVSATWSRVERGTPGETPYVRAHEG